MCAEPSSSPASSARSSGLGGHVRERLQVGELAVRTGCGLLGQAEQPGGHIAADPRAARPGRRTGERRGGLAHRGLHHPDVADRLRPVSTSRI